MNRPWARQRSGLPLCVVLGWVAGAGCVGDRPLESREDRLRREWLAEHPGDKFIANREETDSWRRVDRARVDESIRYHTERRR